MHLKNFSLIEDKNIRLSPFYDLLPVNILINDSEDVALTLNSKKRNIKRNDFLKYANTIKLEKDIALKLMNKILKKEDDLIKMIDESLLDIELKIKFKNLMIERFNRLKEKD